MLKEKLKLINLALKKWHVSYVQNSLGRINSLKDRISELDCKGEDVVLLKPEIEELHGLTSYIPSLSRINTSICWQQSRLLGLREGDTNSKYFHSILFSRRRGNSISSILFDGVFVEGVIPIQEAIFSHCVSL